MAAPALETTATENRVNNNLRGALYMVTSIALFSCMDGLVKHLGETYPTAELIFFRSAFAFIPLSYLIWRAGVGRALKVTNRWGHVARILAGITAMGIMFYCFPRMPLADMIAITFAAPIFVTLLSMPLLGEKVGPRRWAACLIGFVGVVIMVKPGSGLLDPLALLALLGTFFYALAMILVRRISRTETSTSIVFTFTLACTALSAVFLPAQWVTPTPGDLALLVAVGLIGGLAQITMTNAFRDAEAAFIIPLDYTAMIWATGIGYFVWGDIPGMNIWVGVAIVIASGLYIVYRETNLGMRRGVARKLQTKD